MKKNWFTIIIANYNGEKYLETCLSSVFKSTYRNFKVIVVDDASTDSSLKILHKFKNKHKNMTVLRNSNNLGPSGSRNRALDFVNTEYIYFLDNDTEVDKNWLKEVELVFKKNSEIGGVQSWTLDFDERNKILNGGLKLIPQTGWAVGISQDKNVNDVKKNATTVLGLSAALAVKKAVFDKSIIFDKAFFHYSEDLDFSWRTWIAGFPILSSPRSIVYHKVKKIEERRNVGANKEIVYYHLVKNSLRSITKNYSLKYFLYYFPQAFIVVTLRAFLVLLIRKDSSALTGTIKAFIWFIKNLQDTLKERKFVQNTRVYQDREVLGKIAISGGLLSIYKAHFYQTKLLPKWLTERN